MTLYIFIVSWVLLTYPIIKMVNDRVNQTNDAEIGNTFLFQILLFLRAFIHVPSFYINTIIKLINKNQNGR
jgi:hypothetical protein